MARRRRLSLQLPARNPQASSGCLLAELHAESADRIVVAGANVEQVGGDPVLSLKADGLVQGLAEVYVHGLCGK